VSFFLATLKRVSWDIYVKNILLSQNLLSPRISTPSALIPIFCGQGRTPAAFAGLDDCPSVSFLPSNLCGDRLRLLLLEKVTSTTEDNSVA
jgi:hypothetical protein